ncbi:MAG: hypothetical protein EA393_02630 [Bacteroidetes bacterium]|nr:MAG: hypothetical protein EA393_02630 [Bacteroidota bacterium]
MSVIQYIPEPFINALAWSVLHSFWQILIIAALWKISMFFARKAPALVRQNLSIFTMLTIPVVFLITFFKQYEIYKNVERIAFLEFEGMELQSIETLSSLYLLPRESNHLSQFFESYTPYIFWIYWAGIVFLSIYFILSYSKLFQLKRKQLKSPPQDWLQSIQKISDKTLGSQKVKVYLSPNVTIPIVAGFFKPVILFPLAVSASLTIREVEEILLHELYHIRCKDHYINALQYIFEILFFYHPCTWWISRNLRIQREAKVDEWVVKQTNSPLNYAQTLINLEENRKKVLQPALAASSSQNSLFIRIKNIMHMKTRNFKPGQKIAAIVVIAAASISLAWFNPPSFLTLADANDFPAAQNLQADNAIVLNAGQTTEQVTPPDEPKRIVLENGTTVQWQELSDEDKEEIRKAMEEARIAIRDAIGEVRAELNSEEIKKELHQAREEIRQALAEVKAEMNNEEFRAEMQQAREEIRKALQYMNQKIGDEQFKSEIEEVSKELQKVFEELNNFDWSELGNNLGIIMEEVGKSLEIIGPTLKEVFENLNLEELFKELENELQEN